MSASVKVCGCRPHDGGAAHTGAGVRKPPREETAGGGAKQRVRRYGIFGAGDLLPAYVELFGRRSKGWRAQLADRDSSTGVAQQRLIDEAVVQGGATASMVMAGREPAKCSTGMSRRTYSDHDVSILITAMDAAGR